MAGEDDRCLILTTPTIDPEIVLRAIRTLYQDEYQTSLDTVRDFWLDRLPIAENPDEHPSLTNFEVFRLVADPSSPGRFPGYPALGLAMSDLRSMENSFRAQQLINDWQLPLALVYYLRGIDSEYLSILVMRHTRATLDLIERFPFFGLNDVGLTVVDIGTPSIRPSSSILDSDGTSLVKGVLFEFNIRFQGFGF